MHGRSCFALALLWLSLALSQASPADVCDSLCQIEQGEAVRSLFASVGQTPEELEPLPSSHCRWQGVFCCAADSVVDLSPSFPGSSSLSCRQPYGVSAVLLRSRSLSGSLPEQGWAALASSLQYLDMEGKPVRPSCLPVSVQPQLFNAFERLITCSFF